MTHRRRLQAFLLVVIGASHACSALAQQSTPAGASGGDPQGATLESDPLRCWLKSTKTSVHVGEQFNVALTCAVVETTRAVVIADVSHIEPASIQMAPFEVLSGRRHPDIRSGMWRYFQYEYTVRLVADGFFGQDLAVPPISLSYRVNLLGAGATQEGREKTYVLPQLPIRIVSLVPTIATDIRDAARDTFADIAARNVRANVAFVVAGILYAFAGVMTLVMLVRGFGALRRRNVAREQPTSAAALASFTLQALRRVRAARAAQGWTHEVLAQGLALARIAGALATDRPLAQAVAMPDAVFQDGQVFVPRGLFRRRALLLSASLTPHAFAATPTRFSWPDRGPLYVDLQAALSIFSEARYARTSAATDAELDTALERVRASLQKLRVLSAWPVRMLGDLSSWWRSRRGPGWAR